jgi:hypothetical protein
MANMMKKTFQEVSAALMDLHRDLLMLEARHLEGETGRKLTPYELLHASLHDPNLAWLRQISALIVSIDTTIDEIPNLSAKEANQIANEVLSLLEKPDGLDENDFWGKYTHYLAHHPDIVMKHSRVKTLVSEMRPKM